MARRRLDEGFEVLKIEGGPDVDEDIARVLAVRKAVGPDIELRFDANQGYDVEEAVRFGAGVRDAALELIEQPTPRRHSAWLGRVNRRMELPVVADESLSGRDDAHDLVAGDRVDHFNVKLQKVGGITEASRIAEVARSAGLGILVGSGPEPTLGIAAGLAFALGTPGVLYAELDGHLGLSGDPSAGLIRLERGVLHPPPGPGLGWDGLGLRSARG
jgi:L-alanine-DL-glutamate epimerase-like enolase superfamily enzyme